MTTVTYMGELVYGERRFKRGDSAKNIMKEIIRLLNVHTSKGNVELPDSIDIDNVGRYTVMKLHYHDRGIPDVASMICKVLNEV